MGDPESSQELGGWHKDLSLHIEQCFFWLSFKLESSSKLCPVVATDDIASCVLLPCLVQPMFTLPNISFVFLGVYPLLFSFIKTRSHLEHTLQMNFWHLALPMFVCS